MPRPGLFHSTSPERFASYCFSRGFVSASSAPLSKPHNVCNNHNISNNILINMPSPRLLSMFSNEQSKPKARPAQKRQYVTQRAAHYPSPFSHPTQQTEKGQVLNGTPPADNKPVVDMQIATELNTAAEQQTAPELPPFAALINRNMCHSSFSQRPRAGDHVVRIRKIASHFKTPLVWCVHLMMCKVYTRCLYILPKPPYLLECTPAMLITLTPRRDPQNAINTPTNV
jgi:hypothetical protein